MATAKIDPIRGAVSLLGSFTRNLAFYRVSLEPCAKPLLGKTHPDASFWCQVHSNFVDMLTLEWCKLFGDSNSRYHWQRVIPKGDQSGFEQTMLRTFSQDRERFLDYVISMRRYRDKFVAHLDIGNIMEIPCFDEAEVVAGHYHSHLVRVGLDQSKLVGLTSGSDDLRHSHGQFEQVARRIYLASRGATSA